MARIEGLKKVVSVLQKKALASKKDDNVSCVVGYTAAYALYVHEKIEMKWKGLPRQGKQGKGFYWDPQGRGQAKFLEGPARKFAKELGMIVATVIGKGRTLAQGLLAAGLRLLRESQLRVPVDTGNLKASGYVRMENNR